MNFSRWAGWGDHRHPVQFSGDTESNWDVLEFLVPFTSAAGNVGAAFWSHDIGGHIHHGGRLDPELFVRWVQFGALSPVLRVHSTRDKDNDRRPWLDGEPWEGAARRAYALRTRLQPYLYGAARACHDTGMAPVRPMYLSQAENEEAYRHGGRYLLGGDLLVAPAVRPGFGRRKVVLVPVWFPEGDWYHLLTHEHFRGPLDTAIPIPLEGMAVFARGGAPIPMDAPGPSGGPVLRLYPGDGTERGLYEDDGESEGYLQGAFRTTALVSSPLPKGGMSLQRGPAKGGFRGASASLPGIQVEGLSFSRKGGEDGFLVRVAAGEAPLEGAQNVELPFALEGPQIALWDQARALERRARLCAEQCDPGNRLESKARELADGLADLLQRIGSGAVAVEAVESELEGWYRDALSLTRSLASRVEADSKDALRVLSGLSMDARVLPGADPDRLSLEVEVVREAGGPLPAVLKGRLSCQYGGQAGAVEAQRDIPAGGRVAWRFDLPDDFRFLGLRRGRVDLKIALPEFEVLLSQEIAWLGTSVREWDLLGPLRREGGPPVPAKEEDLAGAAWRPERFDPVQARRGSLDQDMAFGGCLACPKSCLIAAAVLEASEPAQAGFLLRHEGKAEVWINGREILPQGGRRSYFFAKPVEFQAELKQGANLVVVRLEDAAEEGGFQLSLQAPEGRALRFRARRARRPSSKGESAT